MTAIVPQPAEPAQTSKSSLYPLAMVPLASSLPSTWVQLHTAPFQPSP